jgi:hypothetical protein|tara:strand:- start:358 stop:2913 length:2556 start_codon:yes stop_codon:yes gene_type:complete
MSAIKIIGKLNPKQYSEMLDHLTRKKIKNPFIKAKDIVVDKKPEVEQTEMFNRFNKANPRQDMAGGGMLVQPGFSGVRQGYAGKDKKVLDKDTIKKIKDKITLKPGQKWNFYDPKKNPKGHTYGVPKGDPKYDIARNLKPGRLETKLKKATEKYKEIKANPKLLAQKKAYDRELYQSRRTNILKNRRIKYETDKDFREKKLEWARQDKIKNPEKYKQKLNDYFAKKGRFPPGNNYKENVWRDMFRSSQKLGQERFLLVDEKGNLLTEDKFPKVDGKVRWDVGGAYKKVKFYDTVTKQFVKLDNSIKGKGITFEKYLDQKSVGGKGAYKNAINGYKNKDDIKNLTFKDSKGKTIRLGTIVQERLNDGANYINSGVNVQHPDLNNTFWKNEVTLASANNELNYLEQTLERQLKNAGNDTTARNKAINNFKSKINRQPGGITKIVEGETLGVKPTTKSVVEAVGKEFNLNKFKDFKNLVATLGGDNCGRGLKNQGGRVDLRDGTPSVDVCFTNALERIRKGGVDFTNAEAINFNKLTKGLRAAGASNIIKFGVLPEILLEGALIADKMASEGDSFAQGLRNSYLAIPFQALGVAKTYEEGEKDRILAATPESQRGKVLDVFNLQDTLNKKFELMGASEGFKRQIAATDAVSDGPLGYVGDSQDLQKRLSDTRADLQDLSRGDINRAERILTSSPLDLNIQDQLTMDAFKAATEKADADKASRILVAPGTGLEDVQIKKRMKDIPITPEYAKEQLQATGDYYGRGYTPFGLNKLFTLFGMQNPRFGYDEQGVYDEDRGLQDYTNYLRTLQFAENFRDEKAGGGIAKLAGDRSGPPPEKGPNSQGLLSLMKRGMKI